MFAVAGDQHLAGAYRAAYFSQKCLLTSAWTSASEMPKVMKHATGELEEGAALTVTLNPRFREEKGA